MQINKLGPDVKLFLFIVKVHTVKTYGEVEVKLHALLTWKRVISSTALELCLRGKRLRFLSATRLNVLQIRSGCRAVQTDQGGGGEHKSHASLRACKYIALCSGQLNN
jgi:hypothetical protein